MKNEAKWAYVKDTAKKYGLNYKKLTKIINRLDDNAFDKEDRLALGIPQVGIHLLHSKNGNKLCDVGHSHKLMEEAVKVYLKEKNEKNRKI
jgi:arginine decarboxylase-like protein